MTTRLMLVCHAPTGATRSSAFPADEPLEDRARQRLPHLAHGLARADRFWTSPALRATQTAAGLQLDATTEPRLRDCDVGRWKGRRSEDIQAEEPEALAAWLRDPAAAPHGGESVAALIERVGSWLDEEIERPGRVVAVTHAAIIRAAILHAIRAAPSSFWHIDIGPLSVTRLSGNGGRWTLAGLGKLAEGGEG